MALLTIKELLETGVHFGHRVRKWNPKMEPYIYTERKGIHIVDLERTIELFEDAYHFVRDQVAEGKEILFVGTKRQVQRTIEEEAERVGAHYVNRRWIGGTLTNFPMIKQRIDYMSELEEHERKGDLERLPNKEAMRLRKEINKLRRNFEGLRHMARLPDMLFIVDTEIESNAVHEAQRLGIPIVAIIDTNCDPDPIDYPIPGNDDAIKATKLLVSRIADAVLEGKEGQVTTPPEPEPEPETVAVGEPVGADRADQAEEAEEPPEGSDGEGSADEAEATVYEAGGDSAEPTPASEEQAGVSEDENEDEDAAKAREAVGAAAPESESETDDETTEATDEEGDRE